MKTWHWLALAGAALYLMRRQGGSFTLDAAYINDGIPPLIRRPDY